MDYESSFSLTLAAQNSATHCNTLHRTAAHCIALGGQHSDTVSEELLSTVARSSQLPEHLLSATHCNSFQHTATHCNTLQHSATDLEARTVTALLNTVARSSQLREHLLPDTRQKLLNYLLEATKIGHPFMTHIWDTYIGYRGTLFPRYALEMTDLPSRGHQKQARSHSI